MHLALSILALVSVLTAPPPAEERIDQETIARIKMDVYDHVSEEDLKQAAVVVASVAYLTARRDEKLPRKPLPGPRKKP